MEDNPSLHKVEVGFYFVTCVCGIFYSTYQLYLAGSFFDYFDDIHDDFSTGWSWIGRKKDVSDHEWAAMVPFLRIFIPWVILHLLISNFIKYLQLNRTILCCWYITISLAFLWTYIGVPGVIFMLIQPCIVCLLISIRNLPLIYFAELGLVFLYHYKPLMSLVREDWLQMDSNWDYLLTVSTFWVQLRSTSCAIDNVKIYRHKSLQGFLKNFIETTAYCLYFPTLFMGPFFLYEDFHKGINRPNKWTLSRLIITALNLLRFSFWILFTEIFAHFLYITAFKYQPQAVEKFNSWAFFGFGYWMGQYLCNKYVIFYGLPGEFTRADNINAPPPPKCIGRIFLYSELWREFDRGLYLFLVKYIYSPIISYKSSLSKLFASMLTFSFVYVWHGPRDFVLVWSALSFFGVTVERIARSIGKSPAYNKIINKYLSPQMNRRLNCYLTTHLFIITASASFYFLGRMEIGNLYLYRAFCDPLPVIIIRSLIIYTGSQISVEIKNYYKKKLS
ncbi:protein-cysteine N-palmitoyltransferase HHAT-like isoform X2 [Cotesia glomerata]|uniref:protein-cysteine N-palmitoyltransferase HHAT-like isoform X2 n=1 Tax=Cotesia glomerata TaxID=32391 RepID=UPI001D010C8A|nr:protein-cysteine N-palmitoyltransferase HHAT-like isoform X2 [Cotesia glomerata]